MKITEWIDDIETTIKNIEAEKPTKDGVIFLSALYAVKKNLEKKMEHVEETTASILNNYSSYLNDEIKGTKLYIKLYGDTLDVDFLKMAYDECTHAKKFIDLSNLQDSKEAMEITNLFNKINRMKSNIKMN